VSPSADDYNNHQLLLIYTACFDRFVYGHVHEELLVPQ
jgi:hypothetical protein